jgi:hypothetical protein
MDIFVGIQYAPRRFSYLEPVVYFSLTNFSHSVLCRLWVHFPLLFAET